MLMGEEEGQKNKEAAKILFVDDDRKLLEAYRDRFLQLGYEVFIAHTGKDAIRLLQNNPIDLAVLDVMMPEMDGLKLIRLIRGQMPELPIVFLTGKQDQNLFLKAFELKSNALLEKPCTPQELNFQVNRLLAGARVKRTA